MTLTNRASEDAGLGGWLLKDKGKNQFALDGLSVAAGASEEITLPAGKLPLNNSGDEISLFKRDELKSKVSYSAADVQPGQPILFG